jgi:integrase
VLGRKGAARLLAEAAQSPRSLVLYTLAMDIGLGARECAGLDVEDISLDGAQARPSIRIRLWDRRRKYTAPVREAPLGAATGAAVERYLGWRRDRCAHFRVSLQTYRDGSGVERCHACADVADFLKAPMFLGRNGQRVSAQWLREEFAGVRRRLRLDRDLGFGGLGRGSYPIPKAGARADLPTHGALGAAHATVTPAPAPAERGGAPDAPRPSPGNPPRGRR